MSLTILGFGQPDEVIRFREELLTDTILRTTSKRSKRWHHRKLVLKQIIQSFVATCILALASPVVLLTALGLAINLRNFPFRRTPRVGKNGRVFSQLTFECMYRGDIAFEAIAKQKKTNPNTRLKYDPRYSRFSRLVYQSGLSGVPSLWNVIAGDMNFIGPAPHFIATMQLFEQQHPMHINRFLLTPGLGGLHTLFAVTDGATFDRMCDVDFYYITHASHKLDFRICTAIVLRTFGLSTDACLQLCGLPKLDDIPQPEFQQTLTPIDEQRQGDVDLYERFREVYQRLSRNPTINIEQ